MSENPNSDASTGTAMRPEGRLRYFPVPIFTIVMGLMGFALALRAAAPSLAPAGVLSGIVFWVGVGVFALISVLYLLKLLRHPSAVAAEWHHPVRLAFFPTITISMLLMATALASRAPAAAEIVWLVAVAGQGVLTISVVSGWVSHRSFEIGHLTPAWFIPAMGNVIVPIAGARLGYPELSWLFFSGGVVFWLVLQTLVFNRLIFHDPIPARLVPTLVILIAAPSVAFLAWVALTGEVDAFARILLNTGYFFAILVVVQLGKLATLPFSLSSWAWSFPLAALSTASFGFAAATGSSIHRGIGLVVLGLLTLITAWLVWRTLLAVIRNQICQPEG